MRSAFILAATVVFLLAASAGAQERSWVAHGPDGGYVPVLETDPQRPAVIYAGGAAGLYKSTDSGRSWTRASVGLPADMRVLYLALAPSDPSTLYLLGTPGGLFRSTNGARTWQRLDHPPEGGFDDLDVDPALASRVYIVAHEGLFKSEDSGSTWRSVTRAAHDFVALAPSAPNVLYTGTEAGLVRSADGGATWTLEHTPYAGTVDALAVDPRDPETIYYGEGGNEFYKSTDGGSSYKLVLKTPPGTWISATAIDPRNPRRLFVGARDQVFLSTNGGATWSRLSRGLPPWDEIFDLKVASETPGTAYVSFSAHGVFRTAKDGRRWQFSSRGLAASFVRALAIDPLSPGTVYAGLDGAGVARSTDGGLHWPTRRLTELSVLAVAAAPHVVYAGGTYRIYRSRHGGATWRRVWSSRRGGETVTSLAITPSAPSVVYAGTGSGRIYRSANGGTRWRLLAEFPPDFGVASLLVHPRRPRTLWAVVAGSVFRSTTGGRTWKRASKGVGGTVQALALNPLNPRILYASSTFEGGYPGGGIYKSVDAGSSWKRASGGIDTMGMLALAIDRHHPSTLYAGGCDGDGVFGGLYRTTNAARTWTKISAGMSRTCVASLALTPSSRVLQIGTVRGGVFTKRVR